ncbi:MAG: HEPN domain-containing protein, partial [Nitrospirae bacterium]|nr:HEPN domain-containing protein [Nitrospirota bacterium]
MKPEERDELIRYRLEQADHTLHQAELLAEAAEWDGVVNRAYYAMFYAALALLLTKGMGSSKHAGVLALVDREFVRPGH